MKAMVLHEPQPVGEGPLRPQNVADPEPGPGQIRLRLHVCGVCHTDLHTVEGELRLPKLPLIPGHQLVGVVDALGVGAGRFALGARVGVAWLNWTCGECDYCRRGSENLCKRARFTGLDVDGGYADYAVVDEEYAYAIPEQFSDAAAAPLLCAGIVGYRAWRLTGLASGTRLGLYGFGASAHLVIQVARHFGCEVYVFTRSAQHQRLAEDLGAVWVGEANDQPPVALDAGIIFAPVGRIVPAALGHIAPAGRVVINAIHMSPIPEFPYDLIYEERELRSVANFTRSDAQEFLRLAGEIPIRTEIEVFPLVEANNVLQKLKKSEIRAAAVLQIDGSTTISA